MRRRHVFSPSVNHLHAFREWSKSWRETNRPCLDPGMGLGQAFNIPISGVLRITGPAQSGMTALALQITQRLLSEGFSVHYFDFAHSVFLHRMEGLDVKHLSIVECSSRASLLKYVSTVEDSDREAFIIDRLSLLKEDWGSVDPGHWLSREIRSLCPQATQVFCDPALTKKGWVGDDWRTVVRLGTLRKLWVDGELLAHETELVGPEGVLDICVSHFTGRIHPEYMRAKQEIALGKSMNSVFLTDEGEPIQGFWQFVHKTLKRKEQTDNE